MEIVWPTSSPMIPHFLLSPFTAKEGPAVKPGLLQRGPRDIQCQLTETIYEVLKTWVLEF